MDGRWVLLTLVVAAAAAIRWRRRPSDSPPGPGPRGGHRRPVEDVEADVARVADADAADDTDDVADSDDVGGQLHDRDEVDQLGAVALDGSLQEALERVWAEHASSAEALLYARLNLLVQRGVPVRAIRRAPGGQVVRVVFADNTVVLCQGSGIGDFGRLGLAMHRSAVRLSGYAQEEAGTLLEFRWNPDQHLAAVAVGLDQPD